MRKYILFLTMCAVASPAFGQGSGAAAACEPLADEARQACLNVAQALDAAQPQLGILLAGGNPVPGTSGTGGVRLGLLPRVSATVRGNVVFARLPDILDNDVENAADPSLGSVGIPVPALGANVSVGLFEGMSLAPTLGGFGAVDLLAGATWIPVALFDVEGFDDSPSLAWAVGARVGLLRESFVMPGVAVSLMYRRMGELRVGDVCEGALVGDNCPGPGDPGQVAFDLASWSARATVGKRLLGLGLTAGVGFDRFESDGSFAFRAESVGPPGGPVLTRIRSSGDVELESSRWSVFGNLSWGFLLGSLVLEGGLMQGGDAVPGFTGSQFDPGEGTAFGSVAVRLSL